MLGLLFIISLIALWVAWSAHNRAERLEERIAQLETRKKRTESLPSPAEEPEPAKPQTEPPPLPVSPHPAASSPKEAQTTPSLVAKAPSEPVKKEREPLIRAATLRKLHLLPPEGEGTSEVQIASWWATRIGIVLGVIAAVFFGVHVSENTPPIVRLLGLVGVGILMFLVGLKLEKSVTTFGQILSAGGLAILYVAAFAAYSFEPLRVIESPGLGLALQFLGVVFMGAFALWKHSEPLASLAILLGYVSCWFSHAHDLSSFTLAGLIFFALVAALLFFRSGWLSTLRIAMMGSYSGYLFLALTRWTVLPPSMLVLGTGLLNLLGIFYAAFHATHLLRSPLNGNVRPIGILTNSSVATIVGLITFGTLAPDELKWFYFGVGVVALIMSAIELLRPRLIYLSTTLFLKAMTAFCLFAVVAFEGPTEWFAVALQAGILLYTLNRTRSVWIERAFVLVWLAAWYLSILDWNFSPGFHLDRLAGLSFILIQTSTLSLYQKWASAQNKPRRWVATLAILAGIQLGFLYAGLHQLPWALLIAIGVVSLVSLLAIAFRSWIPCLVSSAGLSILTIYFANLDPDKSIGEIPGFLAGFVLLAAGVAAAEMIKKFWQTDSVAPQICRLLGFLFSTFVLGCFLFDWGRLDPQGIVPQLSTYAGWAVIAALILLAHHRGGRDNINFRVVIAFSLGIALWLPLGRFVHETTPPHLDIAFAIAGTIVMLASFWTCNLVPVVTNGVLLISYLGWILGTAISPDRGVPSWHLLAFTPIQLCLVALWRFLAVRPAIWSAILISLLGFLNLAHDRFVEFRLPSSTELSHYVIFGLGIFASSLLVATASKGHFSNNATRKAAFWAYPVFTSFILLPTFAWPDTVTFPIATALWGLIGISIFIGGLTLRRRSFRVIGLVSLLFCIVRIFVIDLQDTFYRIIAFAAIAVLLLIIGYLYTRFRELIETDDDR